MSDSRLDTYEVITDWDDLITLAPEWRRLWERSASSYLIDTPTYALISRTIPPDSRQRKLVCLVGRRDGRIGLLWPFVVYWNNAWRVGVPLSSEWGDYSGVLVEDGADTVARVRAAMTKLRAVCPCDLLAFSFVRANTPLAQVLAETRHTKRIMNQLEAPLVAHAGRTWETYRAGLSGSQRRDFARKARRLGERGTLRIETITDPNRASEIADWLIKNKLVWLEKTGMPDRIRLRTEAFRQFIVRLMREFFPDRCMVLALTLDGQWVAADLLLIDKVRLQWYVGAFDAAFDKYTPGQMLKEHAIQLAFARGLDFDMLLGSGQHKRFWATDTNVTTTYRVANSVWGVGYVALKAGVDRLNAVRRRAPATP